MVGICPYCGHNKFRNSWGRAGEGNARCARCGQEFNVVWKDGRVRGEFVLPVIEKTGWQAHLDALMNGEGY